LAKHPKVEAEQGDMSVVLLGIIEGDALLPMLTGKGKFS
jgi:hypothetical protein